MKKLIIVPVILFMAAGLQAQVGKIIGGINFSKYHDIDWNDQQSYRPGYWGGLGFEWGAHPLSFELDFLYIQKGSEREISPGNTVYYRLHEISAPFLIKFKFAPYTSPYLLAGAEVAFVVSYKVDDGAVSQKADNIAKPIDYGLVGGGGLEFWLDSLALVLEARYHYGLAEINDGGPFDFKTSSILVLIGFKF